MTGLALAAGAYLLGSIPFGLLLARAAAGVDVREVGSGNIGATNVARAAGRGIALATLALDAGKSAVPVLAARRVLGLDHAGWEAAVGLSALAGHVFPVYLGFRGGKGVATGLGVFLALAPPAALAGGVAWAAVFAATRISSAASLVAIATCAGVAWAANGPGSPVSWAGAGTAALVLLRHRSNIGRLLARREHRF